MQMMNKLEEKMKSEMKPGAVVCKAWKAKTRNGNLIRKERRC